MELPPKTSLVERNRVLWSPPPVGWTTVNTDGSLDLVQKLAGSGYVIGDSNGDLIEGGCTCHGLVEDPFVSELLDRKSVV